MEASRVDGAGETLFAMTLSGVRVGGLARNGRSGTPIAASATGGKSLGATLGHLQ